MQFLEILRNWNVMIAIVLCHGSRFSAVAAHDLDLSTVQQSDIYIRESSAELLPAQGGHSKQTGIIGKSRPSQSSGSPPDSILFLPKQSLAVKLIPQSKSPEHSAANEGTTKGTAS